MTRCEIRRNDLLGRVRIKVSCDRRASFIADLGEDTPLRLCKKHGQEFKEAHPQITVDRLE